jgi:DNA helicase-2/ATP-dependent DNA helicase PcrA
MPIISTLHSFALRKLLQHSGAIQLPKPLRIADDYEERWIIQEDLKKMLGLSRVRGAAELLNRLSADWEQLTSDEDGWEKRFPEPRFLGAWREHRAIYGYTLRAELVYQLRQAFEQGDISSHNKFRHILVDEYQDLNACDLAVIRHLADGSELFVAGDDDQSIYGFRYAKPNGIRGFLKEYRPAEALKLEICKRCDTEILDLAEYVAELDPRREPKNLRCSKYAGKGVVKILRFPNQDSEAKGVARICEWLVNSKKLKPEEILILVRSDRNHRFSNLIRQIVTNRELDVATVSDPLAALKEDEGRHFLCLLRLVANPKDNLAWRTILKIRNNGIGQKLFQSMYDLARQRSKQFHQVIAKVARDPSIIARGCLVKDEVDRICEIIRKEDVAEMEDLKNLVFSMGDEFIEDDDLRSRVVNIFNRIFSSVEIQGLEELLRAINVSLNNFEQEREKGYINIMTMHQAKGLSADAVFIIAAEDEYVPGRAKGDSIEDERRLLYVSLTRARHYLYISHCRQRTGQQRHSGRTSGDANRHLTRFLSGGPVRSVRGSVYLQEI